MLEAIDGKKKDAYLELSRAVGRGLGGERDICIICVGTDRWTGDSLGPIVGQALKDKFGRVYGTLENPLKSGEAQAVINRMRSAGCKTVVVDSALGSAKDIFKLFVTDEKLELGRALGKKPTVYPDLTVAAVVNTAGVMPQAVLQNTRLYHVFSISRPIIDGLTDYCEKTH